MVVEHKNFNREILKCHYDHEWSKWPTDSTKGVPMPEAQKSGDGGGEIIDLVSYKMQLKIEDLAVNSAKNL